MLTKLRGQQTPRTLLQFPRLQSIFVHATDSVRVLTAIRDAALLRLRGGACAIVQLARGKAIIRAATLHCAYVRHTARRHARGHRCPQVLKTARRDLICFLSLEDLLTANPACGSMWCRGSTYLLTTSYHDREHLVGKACKIKR